MPSKFTDCSYQYVGNNLLDAFGIKNTSNTSQAYNFNILFYFDKLTRFDVNYTTHSTVFNWIDYEIKFARDDKLTEDDFYSSLDKVPYKQIYEHSGGNYGDTLFPGGNTAASNYFTIKQYVGSEDTVTRGFYWALTEGTSKLVGFNFTQYDNNLIESHGELNFKLNLLQFYYQS